MQVSHFGRETIERLVIESVGRKQHRGARATGALQPVTIEFTERAGNARTARPVIDDANDGLECVVRITGGESARHFRESRSEDEYVDAAPGSSGTRAQRLRKMQQHARV